MHMASAARLDLDHMAIWWVVGVIKLGLTPRFFKPLRFNALKRNGLNRENAQKFRENR
jgi:hypothetical protein